MSNVYSVGALGIGIGTNTLTLTPGVLVDVAGNINCNGNMNSVNMGMHRNKIINGDMRMDQRSAGSVGVAATSTASVAASAYTVDRFQAAVGAASGAVCATQVSLSAADRAVVGGSFDKAVQISGVPTAGMTTYLPFENSTTDVMGTLSAPIVTGNISYTSSCRVGSQCFDLNGNSVGNVAPTKALDYTVTPAMVTYPLTICAWLNPKALSGYNMACSFGNTASGAGACAMLNMRADSSLAYSYFYIGTTLYTLTGGSITAGNWYHVAIVLGSDLIARLYVNGAQTATTAIPAIGTLTMSNGSSITQMRIGGQCNGSGGYYAYQGLVDDFRMYNRALSVSEITALSGFVGIPSTIQSNLTAQLPFNNNTTDAYGGASLTASANVVYSANSKEGITCVDFTANPVNGTATSYVAYNLATTINRTNGMSISLWVYPSSASGNMQIFNLTANSSSYGLEMVTIPNTGFVNVGISGVSDLWNVSGVVTANAWNHMVVTLTGSTAVGYCNGVQYAYSTFASTSAWNYLIIGSRVMNSQSYKGLVDDFRIYNSALSSAQVAGLYYSYSRAGYSLYRQPIEGFNIADLAWGTSAAVPATVSAWIKNNSAAAQQYSLSLNNANSISQSQFMHLPLDGDYTNVVTGTSGALIVGSPSFSTSVYQTGTQSVFFNNVISTATFPTNYVKIINPLTATSPFSMSMWFRTTDATKVQQFFGTFSGPNYAGANGHFFELGANGTLAVLFNSATAWTSVITAAGAIQSNTWYHATITFNTSNLGAMYLNGSLVGTVQNTGPIGVASNFTYLVLGGGMDGGRGFNGYLDDVRLFNKVLTSAQINQVYAGSVYRSVVYTTPSIPANSWQKIAFTVPGETSGTWASDNSSGAILSLALGSGSLYSTTNVASASNNTSAVWNNVPMYSGSNIQSYGASSNNILGLMGSSVLLTGVQMEKGSIANAFDMRLPGVELGLCQRYYQPYSKTGIRRYIENVDRHTYPIPTMRALPTIVSSYTTGVNVGNYTMYSLGASSIIYDITYTSSGNGVVDIQNLSFTCNAEL
jgi:hypothetical protein